LIIKGVSGPLHGFPGMCGEKHKKAPEKEEGGIGNLSSGRELHLKPLKFRNEKGFFKQIRGTKLPRRHLRKNA